jgi:hypothetical protein
MATIATPKLPLAPTATSRCGGSPGWSSRSQLQLHEHGVDAVAHLYSLNHGDADGSGGDAPCVPTLSHGDGSGVLCELSMQARRKINAATQVPAKLVDRLPITRRHRNGLRLHGPSGTATKRPTALSTGRPQESSWLLPDIRRIIRLVGPKTSRERQTEISRCVDIRRKPLNAREPAPGFEPGTY